LYTVKLNLLPTNISKGLKRYRQTVHKGNCKKSTKIDPPEPLKLSRIHCSTLKSLLHRTSFSSSKLASFHEIEIYYLSFFERSHPNGSSIFMAPVAKFIVADTTETQAATFFNFFSNLSSPYRI